jgi:hypothetical protein
MLPTILIFTDSSIYFYQREKAVSNEFIKLKNYQILLLFFDTFPLSNTKATYEIHGPHFSIRFSDILFQERIYASKFHSSFVGSLYQNGCCWR